MCPCLCALHSFLAVEDVLPEIHILFKNLPERLSLISSRFFLQS